MVSSGRASTGPCSDCMILFVGATRQVCTSDGAGEQRISCDQLLLGNEVQADASLGVTRSVENVSNQAAGTNFVTRAKAGVDHNLLGRTHADPGGLQIQHLQQGSIVLVQQNRSSREPLQLGRSAYVIDVRVGNDDLLHRQSVALHDGHHVFDVVAGIDDHAFFRLFIADH